MIKKTNTRLVVAAVSLAVLGSLAAPQALAHKRHKSHKMQHHATRSYSQSGSSEMNSKVDALEAQLRAMQDEISSLRAGGAGAAAPVEAAKVQELDAWMASVKAEPVKSTKGDNLIFFRGGFARNDSKRNDLLTGNQFGGTGVPNVLGGGVTNKDGWYVGAGFDFGLTDDVWGLLDDTQVLAELSFDYRNFGAKHFNNAGAIVQGTGPEGIAVNPNPQNGPLCTLIQFASNDELNGVTNGAGNNSCNGVTVSQFTLSAAPKIKFLKGSAFRPWIIPFGLSINVISPPSNGVTVLNPGVVFGTGAEYAIWKAIKIGADVRYNLTGRSVDGVNTDGITAGGYLGIGF